MSLVERLILTVLKVTTILILRNYPWIVSYIETGASLSASIRFALICKDFRRVGPCIHYTFFCCSQGVKQRDQCNAEATN